MAQRAAAVAYSARFVAPLPPPPTALKALGLGVPAGWCRSLARRIRERHPVRYLAGLVVHIGVSVRPSSAEMPARYIAACVAAVLEEARLVPIAAYPYLAAMRIGYHLRSRGRLVLELRGQ